MYFQHAETIRAGHPGLAAAAITTAGVTAGADAIAAVDRQVERFVAIAQARLAESPESDLAEIKAWRQAFAKMGLKPTQYRCASEALLRRLRKEGSLPRIHPLIDLCNAVSVAFAIPIAALDLDRISGDLVVRPATGDEEYLTFSGAVEHPEPGEIVFADAAGQAHARRWTNRQSGLSAVRPETSRVLIVAEALHASAADDVANLAKTLVEALTEVWHVAPSCALLSEEAPRFEA
jgi:DNA/RNA-binding domain of Phe-tRNA-synthetase-like protein